MKIIAICGAPGTGKSTLMSKLMKELKVEHFNDRVPLVPYHTNTGSKIIVLGKYEEGEGYAQGTDRMSMAVQPKAIEFVTNCDAPVLMFEGDRLSTATFLEHCLEVAGEGNFQIVMLQASKETREGRYADRGSDQDDTWLKGRLSKLSTIQANFFLSEAVHRFSNEDEAEQAAILDYIKEQVTDAVDHEGQPATV